MKKFKFAFVAIALIGILSAFATSRKTIDQYKKVTTQYVLLDPAKRGVPGPGGWDCFTPLTPVCTYKIKSGITPHDPLIDDDMEPLENGTFTSLE